MSVLEIIICCVLGGGASLGAIRAGDNEKFKEVIYYTLGVDLLFSALVIYTGSYNFPGHNIITICCFVLFIGFGLMSFFTFAIYFYSSVLSSAAHKLPQLSRRILRHSGLKTRLRNLTRLLLSEEEEEYIAGDLREEFIKIRSKSEYQAYVWLYKQVLNSVLPLAYENLKDRLASYIGERAR